MEINCPIDKINIIYDLISEEDVLYIKYLKNCVYKNKGAKI